MALNTAAPTWFSSAKTKGSKRAIPFSSWSSGSVYHLPSFAHSRHPLAIAMPTKISSEWFFLSHPCQYEVFALAGTRPPATVREGDKRLTLHAKCASTESLSHVAVGRSKVFRKLPVTLNFKHTSKQGFSGQACFKHHRVNHPELAPIGVGQPHFRRQHCASLSYQRLQSLPWPLDCVDDQSSHSFGRPRRAKPVPA